MSFNALCQESSNKIIYSTGHRFSDDSDPGTHVPGNVADAWMARVKVACVFKPLILSKEACIQGIMMALIFLRWISLGQAG